MTTKCQQFRTAPPLYRVAAVFTAATGGCPFTTGTTWKSWSVVPLLLLEPLREYIRPSHCGLLDKAIAETTLCAGTAPTRIAPFLRQVLRALNFRIDAESFKGPWALAREGDRLPLVTTHSTRTVLFG